MLGQGDEVNRLIVIIKIEHPLIEMTMSLPVEMIRNQNIRYLVHGIVIYKDTTQYCLLRLYIMRGYLQ